jgi:ribosomal protein L13E
VKESKLEERQYHMARERIEAYLSAMKYNSQPRGFSAGELQALGARRADLEKVM